MQPTLAAADRRRTRRLLIACSIVTLAIAEPDGVQATTYAAVFTDLDCVSTNIQRARASSGRARSLAAKAKATATSRC